MKADSKSDGPAASKKKLMIIIIAAILVTGIIGGGAAFFLMGNKKSAHKESAKGNTPVFVAIEPFTVNLQPENGAEQYLQVSLTLQVDGAEQVELIKLNMPKVRSRLLMLLSSKHGSELITSDGKQQLAAEIIAQVKQPFEERGPQQDISDVLFTSFIIQ